MNSPCHFALRLCTVPIEKISRSISTSGVIFAGASYFATELYQIVVKLPFFTTFILRLNVISIHFIIMNSCDWKIVNSFCWWISIRICI